MTSKFFHLNNCKYRLSRIVYVYDVAKSNSRDNEGGYSFIFMINEIHCAAEYKTESEAVAVHASFMKALEGDSNGS